jgi:hypothetical protein
MWSPAAGSPCNGMTIRPSSCRTSTPLAIAPFPPHLLLVGCPHTARVEPVGAGRALHHLTLVGLVSADLQEVPGTFFVSTPCVLAATL